MTVSEDVGPEDKQDRDKVYISAISGWPLHCSLSLFSPCYNSFFNCLHSFSSSSCLHSLDLHERPTAGVTETADIDIQELIDPV